MGAFVFSKRPGLERLELNGRALACNPAEIPNTITIYHADECRLEEIPDDSPRVAHTRAECDWGVVWTLEVDGCVRFQITAKAHGERASFALSALYETDTKKLVSLRMPGLAAATQADALSRVALPAHGGRVIDPAEAIDGQTDHRYNWILDSFGACGFCYTRGLVAVARLTSMDDMLTSRVGGECGARYAQIGCILRHRYTALDPSYRRAKPSPEPRPESDINFPIDTDFAASHGAMELALLAAPPLRPESGWVPGAIYVRDTLPERPSDYYKGKMVYKLFAGSPSDGVRTTYARMLEIIRDVYARTGVSQLLYIVGFQHQGHDSGYPDVFEPFLGPGTEAELIALARDAQKYNAIISFHDNYDDAYRGSPAFDPDIIARDNSGGLLRGGVWNGAQAYWTSLPRYAGAIAARRLDKTLSRYPFIRDTYHLDVLTASVFRLDFRAGATAGRQQDLEARIKLVSQFRERGLDASSEACGLPFIGAISYFWHMQRVARPLYEGDTRAPIVAFLNHGKADHGGAHTDHPSEILDGLLYGCFYSNDVTSDTPIKHLTDAAFMLFMPLDMLRDDAPIMYEEKGGWKIVTYKSGATIKVNFETLECKVDIGGKRYIQNGTATIPQPDGSILAYTAWEEPYLPVSIPCPLPDGARVKAIPLGVDSGALELTANNGALPLDLPIGVAYRIRLDAAP